MFSFLSGENVETLRDIALIATTLVAIAAAGKVVDSTVRKKIKQVAEWFKVEVTDIVNQSLEPIKKETITLKNEIYAVQNTVNQLTPNGGANLHDKILDIDANIKTLLPSEDI